MSVTRGYLSVLHLRLSVALIMQIAQWYFRVEIIKICSGRLAIIFHRRSDADGKEESRLFPPLLQKRDFRGVLNAEMPVVADGRDRLSDWPARASSVAPLFLHGSESSLLGPPLLFAGFHSL